MFCYRYTTSDFQEREESGELVTIGETKVWKVKGHFSYLTGDLRYTVTYQSDEHGYRANISTSSAESTPFQVALEPQELNGIKLRIPSSALASLVGGGIG